MHNVNIFLKSILKKNDRIVLGLSGGPDSMCLFSILLSLKKEYNLNIYIAHVDHNVRKESKEEVEFVKKECRQKNCVFETIQLHIPYKRNFESRARKERYQFFHSIVKKYQANLLMTAHHGDDLMETILMHITRGSSFKGYAGFKKITEFPNYKLVRPLIYMTKEEIISYCKQNKIEYCIDKTNENDKFTRNRYRKFVLPFLKLENKDVHQKFLKYSEELELVEEHLEKTTQIALTQTYSFGKVNLHGWKQLDELLKKRVIEYILKEEYKDDIDKINEKHLKSLISLCNLEKPNKRINLPLNKVAIKEYNWFYIKEFEKETYKEVILEDTFKRNEKENFIKLEKNNIEKSNYLIRLNSDEIALPLKIRVKKPGDRMQVKNLNGTKKIKDILINEKIPMERRNKIPLVVDSNDTILWIPGVKKSIFDKNSNEFYDIIYKYVISEEKKNEKK